MRVLVSVHHCNKFNVARTLFSTIRSTSVSVVALMAPRCTTASTSPAFLLSQSTSVSGAIIPAISCFARFRQRSSFRSQSQTTTSSCRRASAPTTFEPINPAPPVTTYIQYHSVQISARTTASRSLDAKHSSSRANTSSFLPTHKRIHQAQPLQPSAVNCRKTGCLGSRPRFSASSSGTSTIFVSIPLAITVRADLDGSRPAFRLSATQPLVCRTARSLLNIAARRQ
jgi:hypothetical protein